MASTAEWYVLFTVFWLAAESGWSAGRLALLAVASRLPTLFGGVLGGRAIDRFGPRPAVLVDAAFRGLATAALLVGKLVGSAGYWTVLVVAAACAATSPLTYAGLRVFVPDLVPDEQLGRANTVLSLGDQLPIVLSAALAGPALIVLGPWAFAGPPLLMLAVLALVVRLPRARPQPEQVASSDGGSPGRSLRWASPSVVALIALSTTYFFVYGPYQPLLPRFVESNLSGGAGVFSLLRIATGLGAVAGLLVAPYLTRRRRPGLVNAYGTVLYGAVMVPAAFTHSVPVAVSLYFLSGVIWGPYAAVEATALQRWVPRQRLGRVFGIQRALIITALPLGAAVGSLALDTASASAILAVSALACAATGLLALSFPPIRRAARAPIGGQDVLCESPAPP